MLPYNIEGSVTFQGLRACGTQPMCVICSFYYHNLGGCIVYVSYLWPRILLFFRVYFCILIMCMRVCFVLFSGFYFGGCSVSISILVSLGRVC